MNYLIPTIFICLQVHSFGGATEKLESPKSLLNHLQNLENEKSSEEDIDDNNSVAEIDVRNPLSTVRIDYDNNIITLESRGGWTREDEQKRAMNKNFMRFGKRQNEYVTDGKQYDERDESKEEDFSRYSRPSSFMRFGRGNDFMRFGKRANDFMRFGRANEFMRFGRASANNFMRFGRSQGNRYGRSSDPFFTGHKVDNNFMRFGRPDSFMRFGRGGNGNDIETKPDKPTDS